MSSTHLQRKRLLSIMQGGRREGRRREEEPSGSGAMSLVMKL
jgi:hypothetical protein